MYGDIFVCVSCERWLFSTNVRTLTGEVVGGKWQIKKDLKDGVELIDGIEEKTWKECVPKLREEFRSKLCKGEERKQLENWYICHACHSHMKKNNMPPMCAQNGLKAVPIPPQFKEMTQLEQDCCAMNKQYTKIRLEGRMRWNKQTYKVINVPIKEADMMNTVAKLPRTPEEAGLIQLNWKYKKDIKTPYKAQLVNAKRILDLLAYLKENKNPHYKFYDDYEAYQRRLNMPTVKYQNEAQEEIEDLNENVVKRIENLLKGRKIEELNRMKNNDDNDSESEEKEEENYKNNDPVRKYQPKDYDESVLLANMHPETEYKDDTESITIAPGEGNVPKSVLSDKDWDVKGFPLLHSPDGKYALHHKREVKLTDQNYFVQRIQNYEMHYGKNIAYTYAAANYIEQKQMYGNMAMEGRRGREHIGKDGKKSFKLDDAYASLDTMKGTPRYWQTVKKEMYAKLDNHGPFHLFFTLSCGDTRWMENLATILVKAKGFKVHYNVSENAMWSVEVEVDRGNEVYEWIKLEEYLEEIPENLNTHIRDNILTMARYFNQRVKAFVTEVVMGKNNPMATLHWTYKTEFQGRGAAHVHGVLWLNLSLIENYIKLKSGKLITEKQIDKIPGMRKKIENEENMEELKERKPFKYLKQTYDKIRNGNTLDDKEITALANFTDAMVTVSKNPAELEMMCPAVDGEKLVKIVEEVNTHRHTLTCKKRGEKKCRFNYKKYPSWKTVIARPPGLKKDEKEKTDLQENDGEVSDEPMQKESPKEKHEKILKKVAQLMEDDDVINEIMEQIPKSKSDMEEKYRKDRKQRIQELLKRANVSEEDYIAALENSPKGYTIVLKRDLDEMMVNSYNPEWLNNWNANIDVQPVHDFFGAITYVTEYWGKDESKTMVAIKSALENCPDDDIKEKMKTVGNAYMKSRQMGEVEARYKLLPDMMLKNSSSGSRYVGLEDPTKGYQRWTRVEEGAKKNEKNIEIEGKDGLWTKQPDILDKYLRMVPKSEDPDLKDEPVADPEEISLAQVVKMYGTSANPSQKRRYQEEMKDYCNKQKNDIHPVCEDDPEQYEEDNYRFEDDTDMKFRFLMSTEEGPDTKMLPQCIKLADPKPGELPFLRLKDHPVALRYHKSNMHTKPEEYFRKEIMLYLPGWDERLFDKSEEELLKMYEENKEKIKTVKRKVMEHLESVEEARLFVEEANAKINLEATAQLLDAETEQDKAENEGIEDDNEDLLHMDQEIEEESPKKNRASLYKPIDLSRPQELEKNTQNLDNWQRMVIDIVVKFGKDIRKAEKNNVKPPKPHHLMIHGGAGAGKSTVIDTLTRHFEKIMRRPGDDGSHPYVIKQAPTGAAASQIEGTTIHSAFNFDFGGKYYGLGDKLRARKRDELKNLKILVIDEISMVSSDMLYLINLRLKEIKENDKEPFGGVMLVILGDLLQLRPVNARYIFEEPMRECYQITYSMNSLWKLFTVLNLEENHRQENDKRYADLLNRMRIGNLTDDDMQTLQERVRSRGDSEYENADMFISGTREQVRQLNQKCLKRIQGDEIVLQATHCQELKTKFTPNVSKGGVVGTTGYMDKLTLKIGCKVMMIENIKVADGLSNGQLGMLEGVERAEGGEIHTLMIKFKIEKVGKTWREENPKLATKYPGCTGIKRVMHRYSKNYKQESAKNVQLHQFPIILAHAVTAHKIQGQTIKKPTTVAMDLSSVFTENQAHVMCGRVEELKQVIIVDKLERRYITTSKKSLTEYEAMNRRSMNANPSPWMKKTENTIKITSLNCMKLKSNIKRIRQDPTLLKADVINLSETWLEEQLDENEMLQIEGYNQYFTSKGEGKGIASYYKKEIFCVQEEIAHPTAQITKLSSRSVDVIHVYRSSNHKVEELGIEILNMVDKSNNTLIMGDFNICYKKNPENKISKIMKDNKFKQMATDATHNQGGHLDHVYYRPGDATHQVQLDIERYSPYYSDHDAHCLTVTEDRNSRNREEPRRKRNAKKNNFNDKE